ncbi:tetratricopeptide repeat protein [Moraxella sp. FZLJ2107]|uniref:YfgM family protein n=1 Tax=unclassified Moraxella TaxID=2685852 RepID=UPI0020C85C80|nr:MULTISPECIES: tetratricopeptide repeat protein [unclassified Moraxella]UTO05805.1 tetratricopeptide repeat protein [Moraxella sp. FZLJ2107]UTO22541.1 tetratricopeptide repeat protein [Moraxella sp. FZLJ2109]
MSETKNNGFADSQSINALKMHGEKIIYAVLLVLAAFFGWQYYQKHYAKVDTVAADKYTVISDRNDQIVLAAANGAQDEATKKLIAEEETKLFADIDALVAEHGDTAYAWQALMIKARHQTDNDDLAGAVTTLSQATAIDTGDEGLAAITKIRYARAMLANNDIDGATAVANETMPEAFEPSRQELLGDIAVAKNDTESAKKAYLAAWDLLKARQENRAVLSLKLQALGVIADPIEVPTPIVNQPTQQAAEVQGEQAVAEPAQDAQAVADASAETQTTQTGN